MKVLVAGAAGQLGQAMAAGLSVSHEVVARTRQQLNIADWPEVAREIDATRPEAIINCAGYNDVNAAEHEVVQALEANSWGPKNLARGAAGANAIFVHFSTDFVFDGETSAPYTETDRPSPKGRYAMSKLLGEWLAADAPLSYVLRVESLFGGARAKSSVDMLLHAIRNGQPARPFRTASYRPATWRTWSSPPAACSPCVPRRDSTIA
jgi:dTDP-4-dehydrorhamnose reductase